MRSWGRAGFLLALLVPALLWAGAAWAQASGEVVRGSLEQPPEEEGGEPTPLEGVEITVATAGGEEVGTVTSDAEGQYELELPGPGEYTATIDQETLPEGAALRNPDRATLEFAMSEGQQRNLLFPIGERTGGGASLAPRVLQLALEGLKFGLVIAMTAIGLSLIYGTTGLTNFAHGELVTFGALAAYFLNASGGGPRLQLIPAGILAVVLGAAAGGAMDRGLFSPLRRRGTGLIAMLVISIGLSLLLRNIFLYLFGGRTRPFADYAVQRAIQLGPVQIAPKDLITMAISIAVLIAVGLVLQRTRIGKAMRAVADNRDLASSSGINVDRVVLYVWAFGGALAALGGIFQGMSEQVSFQAGFTLLLLMFAGVTLGGLGTAFGALFGSIVIGLIVQLSTLVISTEIKNVAALAVLILILLFRPQGILGRAERVG